MKKKLIRLTEGDLHNIIMETAARILKETDCGGVGGDAGGFAVDTNAPGGSTTTDTTGNYQYDVPFGKKVQRRKMPGQEEDKGVMSLETNIDPRPPLSRPKGNVAINKQ